MEGNLKSGKSILWQFYKFAVWMAPWNFRLKTLSILFSCYQPSHADIDFIPANHLFKVTAGHDESMLLKWIRRIHLRLSRTFKTAQVHVLASDIRPNRVTNISCISIDLFLYTSSMVVSFVFRGKEMDRQIFFQHACFWLLPGSWNSDH